MFLISIDIKTLQVLASSCLPQQIFNFASNLQTRLMKKASNSLHVSKPVRNTRKIANKLNDHSFWRSKHDLIYHVASSIIIFEISPMAKYAQWRSLCESAFLSRVEGRGSRVEGIFSSVEGTLSSVEGTLSRVPILHKRMYGSQ